MNFWEKYYQLCVDKGLSPNTVAKELGISSGSVTWWKKGKIPYPTTVQKIADYFDVPIGYLLGYDTKEKNNDAIADIVVRMRRDIKFFETVKMLDKANEEQLTFVNSMLLAFNK